MSKQTSTSRRKFLKGAAYASALSVGGLSGLAAASSADAKQGVSNGVTARTSSTITLLNQNTRTVALDAKQPISLETVNGWVVVKVNKASAAGSVQRLNLDAGQQLSFTVPTEAAPVERIVFVGEDNYPACLLHQAMT